MKNPFLLFTILTIGSILSCDPVVREGKVVQEGLNINGLLDTLEKQVVSGNPLLIKIASLNGDPDSVQMHLDSAGWSREFQVFGDLKLSPGRIKGRYNMVILKEDSLTIYQYVAKDPKYQQLDSFFITTDLNENPVALQAYIHYSNSLNTTQKKIQMNWRQIDEKFLPVQYKTDGWQKMKMYDTVHFEVEARLIY